MDSYPHSRLDFRQDSKLDCPVESGLDSRHDSYGSKLALRASLRYTGEDDQWQTNCSSLRDRNKFVFNRELFSDVRFLVGRADKTSIPAHRYILAISSPVFSSLFYAFGALQSELTTREQVNKSAKLFHVEGFRRYKSIGIWVENAFTRNALLSLPSNAEANRHAAQYSFKRKAPSLRTLLSTEVSQAAFTRQILAY